MQNLLDIPFGQITKKHPYVRSFFESMALPLPKESRVDSLSPKEFFSSLDVVMLEELGLSQSSLLESFSLFIDNMEERRQAEALTIETLTIIGGFDKDGMPEDVELVLHPADVLSIVGPTGSGKSRLLADIEWLAQGDTPTRRRILIDGKTPPSEWRFSLERKLVAQLSQNMNFVMDVSAADFVRMHAASRMVADIDKKVDVILKEANKLAGEPIEPDTPVTSLSGGQSRALMIADTAFLSVSPIVLIDEIENAGIDRGTAVNLLIRNEKIILIATHDPGLALRADRRIVIRNGAIQAVLKTTAAEHRRLNEIEEIDRKIAAFRESLRSGETLA